MLGYVHRGQPTMILHSIKICNICNVCNFDADLLFWDYFNICNCHHFDRDGCCHPRVMSRSLPHLTLTSYTSPHLPFRRSLPAMFPGRVVDQHKSQLSHIEELLHGQDILPGQK